MATAKKLPSGSWRCLVYSHTEKVIQPDGTKKDKRIYKSFTCDDSSSKGKRLCEAEATAWAVEKEEKSKHPSLTLDEAMSEYIKSREKVCSPRTIMDYECTKRNYFKDLMYLDIDKITQAQIQKAINKEAAKLSPKSVQNIHGLLSAVMKVYRPEFNLTTTLPKQVQKDIYVPTDAEIARLTQITAGTDMELPILLAAFGPMRRGEISALNSKNISGNIVCVKENMVLNKNREWIIKIPKSQNGFRTIVFPEFVAEKFENKKGLVVKLNPNQITNEFRKILKREGIPHFKFHSLRHYSASIQHALGIPDAYIVERGGWDPRTLNKVYKHTLDDKVKQMNDIANKHFEELYNTKCNTQQKNP